MMSESRRFRLSGEIDGRRRSFLLPPGSHSVGSAADRELSLPVAGVSRRHARLRVHDGRVRVEDLESKNGTFVDGRRIDRETTVELGQTIEFGSAILELEEVELEDVELGLRLGASLDSGSAGSDGPGSDGPGSDGPAASTIARTLSVERRDPTTLLLIETVDRLWTAVDPGATGAEAALARFARETFSARAAALVERLGEEEPSALAVDGDVGGDPLADAWPEIHETGEEAPLGFSYFSFGDQGAGGVCGRLRLEERRRDLVLFEPGAHDAVMSPLLHLMLLWSTRRRAEGGESSSGAEDDDLRFPDGHVPGESAAMLELYGKLRKVAPGDVPVLLLGETGVGKEHVARLLHLSSPRRHGPLVAVNCAAIPADLLEAELFGIAGGVATGVRARRGKLEAANGGTLLLDEIGDMPAALQAKLLRVLQEKRVEPLGGAPVELDLRVVAATHADLLRRVEEGAFRRDLYYRLAGFEVRIPPLRERRADIPRLVEVFARRFCGETGKAIRGVTVKALRALIEHPWPGNVRQLEHEVRRLVYLTEDGEAVEWSQLSEALREAPVDAANDSAAATSQALVPRLEKLERALIVDALESTGGNQTRAAERLEISRNGLIQRMKRLDIPSSTGR